MKPEDRFLDMLIEALHLLAADYLTQIEALPDFVCFPDEVISIFSEAYLLFPQVVEAGLVNDNQVNAVKNVKELITEMGEKKDQSIWSMEAMRTHPDWERLRSFAQNTLATFGKTPFSPDLSWITYVKGGKKPKHD